MSIADMERPDTEPQAPEREFSPETDAAKTPEQMQLMIAHSVQKAQAEARAALQKKNAVTF